MDYDIVKNAARKVFTAYRTHYNEFNLNMKTFYSEGINNPSVAQMLLKEEIISGLNLLDKETSSHISGIKQTLENDFKNECEYFWYRYNATGKYLKAIVNAGKILDVSKNGFINQLNKEVLNLKKIFDERFTSLYPHSGYIRKLLLENSEEFAAYIKKYSVHR